MSEDEDLEDWSMMAKEIVSMYRAVWVEVERQFPTLSVEQREQICSFISPFLNNMFAAFLREGFMEEQAKGSGKRKRTR
jgi:dolichyl-phosphate-mannose--protein O-mannosyl transferase